MVLWWHPAVWWLRRQLQLAGELAADEASLLVADGPRALAECLVQLGARLLERPVAGQIPVTGFRSHLGRRVQQLLRLEGGTWSPPRRLSAALARSFGAAATALAVVLCTAWAAPRELTNGDNMKTIQENWRQSLAAFAFLAAINGQDALGRQAQTPPATPAPAASAPAPATPNPAVQRDTQNPVPVVELLNADPEDVQRILQDLFWRSGNIRTNNNNNRNSIAEPTLALAAGAPERLSVRMVKALNKEVTVQLDRIPLEILLKRLSADTGIKIVADKSLPALKQILSMHLEKVKLRDLFRYIARNHALQFQTGPDRVWEVSNVHSSYTLAKFRTGPDREWVVPEGLGLAGPLTGLDLVWVVAANDPKHTREETRHYRLREGLILPAQFEPQSLTPTETTAPTLTNTVDSTSPMNFVHDQVLQVPSLEKAGKDLVASGTNGLKYMIDFDRNVLVARGTPEQLDLIEQLSTAADSSPAPADSAVKETAPTTTFTRLPAVKLTLPETTTAKKSGASESPPLIVTIDAQGNVFLGADSKPVTLPQLKAELVAAVARNPEVTLALRADTAAQWGPILKVLDVVNQTNIKHKVVPAFVKEAGKP
jgi:biopolymer transport protein ExbD